jgi:hypothetical protein
MAQTVEKQSLPENRAFSAELPMTGARRTGATQEAQISSPVQSSMTERLREGRERTGDALIFTKESIAEVYRRAHKCTSDSFINLASASHRIISRARNRTEHLKKEHPLQLLVSVTGAAFAIGMAVRIWRARHYA